MSRNVSLVAVAFFYKATVILSFMKSHKGVNLDCLGTVHERCEDFSSPKGVYCAD